MTARWPRPLGRPGALYATWAMRTARRARHYRAPSRSGMAATFAPRLTICRAGTSSLRIFASANRASSRHVGEYIGDQIGEQHRATTNIFVVVEVTALSARGGVRLVDGHSAARSRWCRAWYIIWVPTQGLIGRRF